MATSNFKGISFVHSKQMESAHQTDNFSKVKQGKGEGKGDYNNNTAIWWLLLVQILIKTLMEYSQLKLCEYNIFKLFSENDNNI